MVTRPINHTRPSISVTVTADSLQDVPVEIPIPVLLRHACDAMIALYRHAPGFASRTTPDTALIVSGQAHLILNWIVVTRSGAPAEAALRDAVTLVRANGLPALVYLDQEAAESLMPVCVELGLVMPSPMPLMVGRAADLPPPRTRDDLEIVLVTDDETLRAGAHVLSEAFQIPVDEAIAAIGTGVLSEPALSFLIARRDGVTLAVTAIFRAGPLLYVDLMATAAASRRQGIGRVLLERALADHTATGATHVFLVASDEGQPLYERLGFRTVSTGTMWEVPATGVVELL